MTQPDNPQRDEWLKGEFSDASGRDPFGESAARGRRELDSPADATDLLANIEARLEAEYGSDTRNESTTPGGAKVRSLGRWYALAAAILLLIVAGTWWINQPTTHDAEAVYAEAFTPYANDLSERTMGGDETDGPKNEALQTALLAYDRRDYAAAAAAFGTYLRVTPEDPAPATAPNPSAISLYYGISQLGANAAEEAATTLEPLTEDATYGLPARWYLALAYLRAGRTEESREILESLARRNDTPFAQKAANLLKILP